MDTATFAQELGRLQGEVEAQRRTLTALEEDVAAIRSMLDQAKGSWKFLVGAAGLAGSLGAAAATLMSWLHWAPPR